MNITNERLFEIYSESAKSRKRYENAEEKFINIFNLSNYDFFSAPGIMEQMKYK